MVTDESLDCNKNEKYCHILHDVQTIPKLEARLQSLSLMCFIVFLISMSIFLLINGINFKSNYKKKKASYSKSYFLYKEPKKVSYPSFMFLRMVENQVAIVVELLSCV